VASLVRSSAHNCGNDLPNNTIKDDPAMSMLKVISPRSQDFSEPVAQMIKLSSRGLIGFDRHSLIKRAGAEFAHLLDGVQFDPDEIPIHLLAVGATEDYGANRNGDGFRRDVCRRKHGTFQKYARFYRDHVNQDPAKSYGIVKLSAYNDAMKRIELICALNGSQAVAKKNGGFLADREMNKLASNQDIAVSMACRVPNDVCSYCNNVARTRLEYCDSPENGGHCKAGGLKHHIGRLLENGHVLHADNPDPTFFDISHVFRPADRIAYVMGQLEKAASFGMSGAEIAEAIGLTAPYMLSVSDGLLPNVLAQVKLAHELAALEREVKLDGYALGFTEAVHGQDFSEPPGGEKKFASVLRALADERIVLPIEGFVRMVTNLPDKQAADAAAVVRTQLPGVFGRLTQDPNFESLLSNNPYQPASFVSSDIRLWAGKQAADLSLLESSVWRRVKLAAVRGVSQPTMPVQIGLEKLAAAATPATQLAQHYALYKLAFLSSIPSTAQDLPLTATFAVLQNYVR
jgi:hypothetical protein